MAVAMRAAPLGVLILFGCSAEPAESPLPAPARNLTAAETNELVNRMADSGAPMAQPPAPTATNSVNAADPTQSGDADAVRDLRRRADENERRVRDDLRDIRQDEQERRLRRLEGER